MDGSLNILIVDDDSIDRMAVRRALMKAGLPIQSQETDTCADTIVRLQEQSFDCVFLDYRLPDQDGLTLISEVRARGIRVPLIVLTGQGDEQIAVQLMKAGATDYLAKSRISPDSLAHALRNAIRVYQAELQAELANQQLRESNELLIRKNQELERQRQQIHLQNLKLLETSWLKSQFLATISHEIRTPLHAIIGFSQVLLRPTRGLMTPQQRDMVERILNNGKQLLELLNDILDFSKIEAGRLHLKSEAFDIVEVVQATVAGVRSLAEEKQLTLQVLINVHNRQMINDPIRLKQVLVNLLSNAIKFTERGSVCVKVNERSGDSRIPDGFEIVVQDTGIGIEPASLDHIFEPFRQGDQTITRKHQGTGLGLAITESLIRMMHGKISVESQLGIGSQFCIELPRQTVPPTQTALKQDVDLASVETGT